MTSFKLIDSKLYADNGDGSYSGVKWCDLQSATLECKCNVTDIEKFKRLILGESPYKEKPKIDLPSKEFITDHIYTLLSSYNQDLSKFEVSVMHYRNPMLNYLELSVSLNDYVYKTKHHTSMQIFDNANPEEIEAMVEENLNALVINCLDEIKTKSKINMKKENDIMAQYTYGKMEVIKTQEEIELEEKIAKLRAEYYKKVAKLREEFKAAKEKKERDAKAKELHDKYQSLIDAGFSTEQAYDILRTKMNIDEF